MSLAMTKQERERFLADLHVGIISIPEEGRGPLTVPIWYSYEPGGELRVVTARTSRKAQLLQRAGRFSLCAQTETLPYRYVSVEGSVVAIEPADLERDRRPLAHRYLGAQGGEVASPVMWKRGKGAFFRLMKCTTSRPPRQAATGGTRHGEAYRQVGRSA